MTLVATYKSSDGNWGMGTGYPQTPIMPISIQDSSAAAKRGGKREVMGGRRGLQVETGRKVEKVRSRVGNQEIGKRKWAEKKRES